MFTGIIEAIGKIISVEDKNGNRSFRVRSPLSAGFRVDQSVAHNGVCLTVEAVEGDTHQVTAVAETLDKTDLGRWAPGARINLERSLLPSSRLDGHFVQGHVDTTAECLQIDERGGSWEFTFRFPPSFAPLVIEKGSVAVNGISLTAFAVTADTFRVAIIPFTYEHTNLKDLRPGATINLEFDLIGKYILRKLSLGQSSPAL